MKRVINKTGYTMIRSLLMANLLTMTRSSKRSRDKAFSSSYREASLSFRRRVKPISKT